MAVLSANRVLSGSFAELWIDGSRVAEASSVKLTVSLKRADVQIGMDIDSKITGWQGTGEIVLRQVFTRFFEIVAGAKNGKDIRITITTALKDPDSMNGEEERFSVSNVALDELPLVSYDTGKINQQTIRFRFSPGDLRKLSGIAVVEVA